MTNNSSFRELLLTVFTVCVLMPAVAGLWYRYHFELRAPQPSVWSATLQTESLEDGVLNPSISSCLQR